MEKKNNLVWIDLEMTGLNPEKNVILEIASIITDKDLNIIAKGPVFIIHHSDENLKQIEKWSKEQHTKSGLLKKVKESTTTLLQAEQQTLNFIKKYCEEKLSPLCGNSIWQDRAFLYRYMPKLLNFMHYRLIDVTSFKEVITRWYPNSPCAVFEKKDTHRALEDIEESIDELKYYRTHFFIK